MLAYGPLILKYMSPTVQSRKTMHPADQPAANPWTRVTARWIKLKNPAPPGLAAATPERPRQWAEIES